MERKVNFALGKAATALALVLATPLAAQAPRHPGQTAWGIPLTDVTPDPAILYGRLPNGMRYAIRRNSTPKGTAAIRLRFEFGSLGEADDERGLAHFIEHMAFNGTTNVAEGEMVRILERQGLAFGPDTNAQTGFDTTTYLLDLPATDPQRLDTALFLMREVASEVKFDPASVNRERPVIESERRARESVNLRYAIAQLAFGAPQTPYAKRIPIGTTQVINTAPAAKMADLYRRYYRPELATLIIVGDIDPAAMEKMVKAKFGDWRGKGTAGAPLPRGRVDLARTPSFASFVAPAIPNNASLSVYRPFERAADTIAERNRQLVRTIATAMFNRRLERRASAAGSVLLGGAMSVSDVEDAAMVSSVSLTARDGEWAAALATAEQEVRRARTHGFTAAELKQVVTNIDTSVANQAAQADTRRNQPTSPQRSSRPSPTANSSPPREWRPISTSNSCQR